MSIGPIPWTAKVQYADRYELDKDIIEAFVDIISEMDRAYMEYQAAEQKRLADMNKPKKVSR